MNWRPLRTLVTVTLLAAIGCTSSNDPPDSSTQDAEPDGAASSDEAVADSGDVDGAGPELPDHSGAQAVEFQELTLWLPEQWEVNVDEYTLPILIDPDSDSDPYGDVTAEITGIATDPTKECDWDLLVAGLGIGCRHIILLSEEARTAAFVHSELTEQLPLAWGAQPPFCEDALDTDDGTNPDPTTPESVEDVTIDGTAVTHTQFRVPCVEEGTSNTRDYTQRLWHFPRTTVVDDFGHEELADLLDVVLVDVP